jgi:hypothetical protein
MHYYFLLKSFLTAIFNNVILSKTPTLMQAIHANMPSLAIWSILWLWLSLHELECIRSICDGFANYKHRS